MVYANDATEDFYKFAPQGSLLQQVHEQKIAKSPYLAVIIHIKKHNKDYSYFYGILQDLGFDKALELILEDKATYGGDMESFLYSDYYPCIITTVKSSM